VSVDEKVLKEWEGLPKETPDQFIEEIKTVFDGAGNSK